MDAANWAHLFGWLVMMSLLLALIFFVYMDRVLYILSTLVSIVAFGYLSRDWGLWWFIENHPISFVLGAVANFAVGVLVGAFMWKEMLNDRADRAAAKLKQFAVRFKGTAFAIDLNAGRVPDSLKAEWRTYCAGGTGLDANLHVRPRPYHFWYKFFVWVPFWWISLVEYLLVKKFPKVLEIIHDSLHWLIDGIRSALDRLWNVLVNIYEGISKKVYAKKLDKSVYDD